MTPTQAMPLKALHPIKFEPIWAEYEKWGWEQQADWALANNRSDCRRKMFIEEQIEFAKERRQADLLAAALVKRSMPAMEEIFHNIIKGVVASGVLDGK